MSAHAADTAERSPYGNRPEEIDLENTYSPPLVYVENVNVTLSKGYMQGDFTMLNGDEETVSDLLYRVEILGEPMGISLSKDPQVLFAEMPVMTTAALTPGERLSVPFSMELPTLPSGKYKVQVQLMQTGGRKLGWGSATLTVEKGDTSFVYLYGNQIILPEFDNKAVDSLTGPNVDPGAVIGFAAQMEHASAAVRTVTPVLEMYPFDTSRPVYSVMKFDNVRLAANTLSSVTLPVEAPQKPGVYMAVLTLRDGEKIVSTVGQYRIVVRGMSADLVSARLASVATKAGETAFANIEFVGSADAETQGLGQLRVDLQDAEGVAGSVFIPEISLTDGVGQGVARIMLTRDLSTNPSLRVVISSAEGKTLRDATVPVKLSAQQIASAGSVWKQWIRWYSQSWYVVRILGLLAAALGVFVLARFVLRYQKFATNTLNLSIMAGMLLAVFFSQTFTGLAWGGTNGIEVAAPRTYRENEAFTSSNINQYRAFWMPLYDTPIVELFVNRPIHNSTIECSAAIELDLRINYTACNNVPVWGRILARVDRSGQHQSTLTGVGANWVKVYDEFYSFSQCPGSACVRTKTSNALISLGLPPGTTQTTLQVAVKHDPYVDGLNPPPDDSFSPSDFFFARRWSQAFNIWLNCLQVVNTDISVVKTAATPVVQQGNQASFTITVTNNGPSAANNVTLSDGIPFGLTFVSSSDNRCTSNGSVVSCNFGTMASGQQIPITFTYQTSAQTQCTTIPNIVSVQTTSTETNLGNNQSSASIQVQCSVPTVDIQVTKTTSTPVIQRGNQGSFTVTVRNNGPSSAANVTLSDGIPFGLTFVSSSDNRCTSNGSVISCNFGTMASGQEIPVTFTYSTSDQTQCTTIPNIVSVQTTTQETNLGNNQASASLQVQCPNPNVDIQVIKTATTPVIQRGNQGSFSIVVRNNGPITAQNVTLSDAVPNGLTFVSSSDNRCTLQGSQVNCAFGSMTSGQEITLTFVYQSTAQTACSTIPNVVTVATTTQETNLANNQSTAMLTVLCPQLGCIDIVKEAFDANGNPTNTIPTFTFRLSNGQTVQNDASGRARFTNIAQGSYTVTEDPLSGWTQQLVTPSGGTVNVASGQSCSTVTFKNRQNPPDTGCIEVIKTTLNAQGGTITPVTQFTFQLDGNQTAQNNSQGVARFNNVSTGTHTITETVPTGWTRLSMTPANGVVTVTSSPNNLSCVQVQITNQQNSFATSTDVAVVKTGPASVQRGSTLGYQLLVTNNGPSSAHAVQVTDNVPAGLTFIPSSSDNRCTSQGSVIVCQLGTMTAGQQISLSLQFQTQQPGTSCVQTSVTNVATVSTSTPDTNMQNNTSQATTQLLCENVPVSQCPDVDINIEADDRTVMEDDDVTFRITLENNDNDDVTVDVRAFLDNDLRFEDADQGGDEDGDDEVEWNDIDIDEDDEEELELETSIRSGADEGDDLRVRVELSVNGRECDDEEVEVTVGEQDVPTPGARMTIDKSVDRSEAQPGDLVTYTLVIRNTGGTAVNSVNIDDVYTAGQLSILDAAGATVSGTRLVWNFDRFEPNSTRTLRYTARIGSASKHGDIVANTVTLTAPGHHATDNALVRVIQQLPQTGLSRLFGGDSTFLRPVSAADAVSSGGSSSAAPIVSILLSGLAFGGYVGKKFLL